ncbi:MotA/TolQ/ExbB proton channel family protein [Sulfurospirillum cavolei]|uniref:MotA/TolQ/ExbB proton channel family protein n=1 Tax=Sulfurospirillum cavolei TaxID=366522 RepID=UPI000764B0D0|nr:MotA/TolQ/ExbB proton channel family protein [Sulfurospirillum cavolei]
MKRIKVLKAYLIIWLFILYVVYTNAELLGIFFMATVIFSTAILGLLAVGTLYQIVSGFHIMMLGGTFGALAYKKTGYEFYIRSIDSLLPANIAHMLQSRKSKQTMFFTQEESRNIIDWLEGKFRQQKSYINFFINTAMLIGLLGTFVGLVEAIDHMGQIILGLNGDIDIKQIMQDFSGPLSGMAIGFGASLFGVVCAVILGINGYILFRSQDTLISGIEDWLKDRIIDVAPEAFNGSAVSSANLPEHRKSFMEVFLEQMSTFTHEISKFSKSNEKLHGISETLTSMKHSIESQHETLGTIVSLHRMHQNEVNRIAEAWAQRDENALKRREENHSEMTSLLNRQGEFVRQGNELLEHAKQTLEEMSQQLHTQGDTLVSLVDAEGKIIEGQKAFLTHHEHVARQSGETLSTINTGVVRVHEAVFAQHETLKAMGEHAIQEDQNAHIRHETLVQSIGALHETLGQEVDMLSSMANVRDANFLSLTSLLDQTSEKLSAINANIANNAAMLSAQELSQKEYFSSSLQENQKLYEAFERLHETLHVEIQTIENLRTIEETMHLDHQKNALEGLEILRVVSATINQTEQALNTLLGLEQTLMLEAKEAAASTHSAIGGIDRSLGAHRHALESILESQKSLATTYSTVHEEEHGTLQRIRDSLIEETQVVKEVLHTTQAYANRYETHALSQAQALTHLDERIAKATDISVEHAAQRKEFETTYFRHTEDEHVKIIAALDAKITSTQAHLESMAQSLKAIEEKVFAFDSSKMEHAASLSEDIKGFFASFFGKHSK